MKSLSLLVLLTLILPTFGEEVTFNEDIRPLFSNSCFHCHGPDEETQEAGLRLDTFEGATMDHDGMRGIVPGDPEASEAFQRIISEDPELVMPPPKHGNSFTPEQVETVRKWIEEGANYEKHWAYQKPEPQAIPEIPDAPEEWKRNPIDAFIIEKLSAEGYTPSAPADKRTLARRVSLDLTGLPPTPEEVEAFLTDSSEEAYSNYVDRLLAQPGYGEHWARMWMDLARYADSAGYADDIPRVIWAYRDYVISAFNDNMPFDQFTREQLAGDLLPDATENQKVATAFHRNTQTNNEGGTNDEEFRNVAVVDRVNTTMATWMGTTMACAQCHTHKYDPITHEEYFQVFDILNQTTDSDKRNEAPFISLFTGAQKEKKEELEGKIQKLESSIANKKVIPAEFTQWESELRTRETQWHPVIPKDLKTQSGTVLTPQADHSILASGNTPDTENYYLSTEIDPAKMKHITAVKVEVLADPSLSAQGPGRSGHGNFVLNHLNVSSTGNLKQRTPARYVRVELLNPNSIMHFAELQAFSDGENVALRGTARQSSTTNNGDAKRAIDGIHDGNYGKGSVTHTGPGDNNFWEVDLNQNQYLDKIVIWNRTDQNLQKRFENYRVRILDEQRNLLWEKHMKDFPNPSASFLLDNVEYAKFETDAASADFEQTHFPARKIVDGDHTKDSGWAIMGETGRSHTAVLPLEKPLPAGQLRFLLKQSFPKHTIGKFRLSVTSDPQPKPSFSESFLANLNTPAAQRSTVQKQEIEAYFLKHNPAFKSEQKELANLKNALRNLKPNTTVPVMEEISDPEKRRETHVHLRGSYLSHGPKVSAGFPKELSPAGFTPENDIPTRLDLANWILHAENPLTARVAANRFWEKIFGIGLVATSEEFGSQGEPPSHPALLDWLALEFRDSGWDVKKLLKLIVTSAAYQQNSHVTPELDAKDPANRLLARGPRVRLSAEMVRDQALSVAGLLSKKMYGAPVNPPQPDMGLKAAFGGKLDWATSQGEDKFRRGLYTTWRRSSPYPSMATFDAPNREVCTVRRDRTNTPLQALVTLNDPVYIEAAQALARRLIDKTTLEDQIHTAYLHALSRPPSELETQRLSALYQEVISEYAEDPDAAKEMATNPIGPAPEGADHAQLASLTLIGNVILNLDEALMKR